MTTTHHPAPDVTLRVDPDGHGIWLGDTHVAWASVERHDVNLRGGLGPFRARRAAVRFENGLTLSILWGSGSYSSNHDHDAIFGRADVFVEEPDRVEIAVVDPDDELLPLLGGDTVMGYVPVADLAANWRRLSGLPSATKAIGDGWAPVGVWP